MKETRGVHPPGLLMPDSTRPRDAWAMVDGKTWPEGIRTYLVHFARPRFIVRLVESCVRRGVHPSELPVDLSRGAVTRVNDRYVLGETAWIDDVANSAKEEWMALAGEYALPNLADREGLPFDRQGLVDSAPRPHARMSMLDYIGFGNEIYRVSMAWRSRLSKRLGYSDDAISGFAHQGQWPAELVRRLDGLLTRRRLARTWPRDEWALGASTWIDDEPGRTYFIHMRVPKFVLRCVRLDANGVALEAEGAIDASDPLSFVQHSERYLCCEPVWWDPVSGDERLKWMFRAGRALISQI